MAVPPPSPGTIVETQLIGSLAGQTTRNVLHWLTVSVAGAPTDFYDFASSFDVKLRTAGSVYDAIKAFCPSNLDLSTRTYQLIQPDRYVKQTIVSPYTGSNISTAQTANVAGVITKQGDLAGRRYRGSIHLVAPGLGAVASDGSYSAPTLTLLNLIADRMNDDQVFVQGTATYTMRPVIFHRGGGGSTDVTECVARQTVRVMRRRTRGVGE